MEGVAEPSLFMIVVPLTSQNTKLHFDYQQF